MNRTIAATRTALISLLALGCAEALDSETGGFAETSFSPATVQLTDGRLALGGTAAGEATTLNIDLASTDVPAGTVMTISGETFFDETGEGSYIANPENFLGVSRVFAVGECAGCSNRPTWQQVEGELRVDEVTATHLTGTVEVTLEGDVPRSGLRGIRTTISGPFRVELAAAAATPTPTQQPSTTAEPATNPNATTADPAIEEPAAPQPTVPTGSQATTISETFEVTLTPEWGVNLSTGDLVTKANFKNCDLYATAGNPWLKLTPGGATPTKAQPMRWFTQSGLIQTFNNLGGVPLEMPSDDDGSKSLVHAKPNVGFVVRANLSNVAARVWIASADENHVTIQWQLIAPAG